MKQALRSVGEFVGVNLFFLCVIGVACGVLVVGMWLMDALDIHGIARALLGTVLAIGALFAAYFAGSRAHAWLEKRI